MANVNLSFLLSILLLNFVPIVFGADKFSRSDFPADFVFGSGTSAYQVCSLYFLFFMSLLND